MPAARYWRIIGVDTYAGGDLEAAFTLYEGATERTGTFSSTFAPIATNRWAAADVRVPGFALVWDLGTAYAIDAVGVAAPTQALHPWAFALQYSSDGVTWTPWFTVYRSKWLGTNTENTYTRATWAPLSYTLGLYQGPMTSNVVPNLALPGGSTGSYINGAGGHVAGGLAKFGSSMFAADVNYGSGTGTIPQLSSQFILDTLALGTWSLDLWAYNNTGPVSVVFSLRGSGDFAREKLAVLRLEANQALSLLVGTTVIATSSATGLHPLSTWRHYAIQANAGVWKVYVDGVKVLDTAIAVNYSTLAGISFGYAYGAGITIGSYWSFDEIRVTSEVVYSDDFTPPTASYSLYPTHDTPPVRQFSATPATAGASEVPAFTLQGGAPTRFDLTDGGTARVTGTVKKEPNVPLARRVRLYDERGRRFIRETWSAPNGDFAFDAINPAGRYTAIAYDHLGQYRALVSDSLNAEV